MCKIKIHRNFYIPKLQNLDSAIITFTVYSGLYWFTPICKPHLSFSQLCKRNLCIKDDATCGHYYIMINHRANNSLIRKNDNYINTSHWPDTASGRKVSTQCTSYHIAYHFGSEPHMTSVFSSGSARPGHRVK